MSRLPEIPADDAYAQAVLASVGRLTGKASDMAKALAHAPGVLQYMVPFMAVLQRSGGGSVAGPRYKELAILMTSLINDCPG